MNVIEIKKMNTIERLQAMEAIWDALLHDDTGVDSPGWHLDILEERKRKVTNGTAEFLSLKELKVRHKA